MPESETDRLVIGSSARGNDDGDQDEADNRDDFDAAKPKLDLAVHFGSGKIDRPLGVNCQFPYLSESNQHHLLQRSGAR